MSLVNEEDLICFPKEMLDSAREASTLLKALGHEHRLLLLCLLADGEKPVIELEKMLAMRQPAVSQQLARLRADDLVQTRRDGKTIYYSIAKEETRHIIRLLYKLYCEPAKEEARLKQAD